MPSTPAVLVVDDSPINRDLMACILEEAGYRPLTAASGAEALELLRAEQPSLVITDVLMSGMNGFELARELRAGPEHADVPLMFWTAHYDSAEVRRLARSLDIAGVLPKPCDNAAVQAAVSKLIAAPPPATPAPPPRIAFEQEQVRVLSDKLVEKADELERTRGALRDSEDRFRILVSNIPGAVYSRATEGELAIDLTTNTIEELTGYSAAALASIGYLSIVHSEDRARVLDELAEARAGDGHYGLAYRIARRDGTEAWVGDRGQFATGPDGELQYGTLSDITVRKRLEADHARMEIELRMAQKLEAVGQLAAGIAHEVNTPIQFVGDGVVFLQQSFEDLQRLLDVYRETLDSVLDAPQRARLRHAEQDADLSYLQERVPAACARTLEGIERVASIVRALKEFAHPQTEQAPADLNRALSTTLTVARNEYRYVAEVVTDFGELPDVVCNLSDINQVFLNLIVNAAHAIQDAPAHTDRLGTITIATRRDGEDAVVTVADDGPGIPAEIQTRIFDPFFTTKAVGRGSGQGLALVRAVVERHGGRLQFETTADAGTTFTVRLPLTGTTQASA